MLDKIRTISEEYRELESRLGDPDIFSNSSKFCELSKRKAMIEPVVLKYREYMALEKRINDNDELAEDAEIERDLREMAQLENKELKPLLEDLELKLRILLLPRDPDDHKNTIIEIRAGAGGDEAGLFVGDLLRMYSRFAEENRWKAELLSSHSTGIGGFKEVIFSISGEMVYSRLKYESGVHRVQRVPATEAQGRIHTSTCTVAVLPEAEEVDVQIDPKDLRIDVFRSSGPGGQSVNTTDSAIRVTHMPTGIVISCQDEKSQLKNKNKALMILRSRLYDLELEKQQSLRASERKSQVGSGDRSERVRTYNFPQNRITDHRIGLTLYKLDEIMEGHIESVIDSLLSHYQAQQLATLSKS